MKLEKAGNVASVLVWGALNVRIDFIGGSYSAPRRATQLALAACLALLSAGAVDSAQARSRHRGESGKAQKAEEPGPPKGPLFFVISTNKQHVSVYGPGGLYARSPVSTGRPDHPTPHGIFSIIGKERYHHSNIYSGAPMPYMQRITWSGVAMHEGVLPGYAASHGCIRMPHDFARRLYGYTEGNERVVISRQDIVPAQFSHPRLPVPRLMPAPAPENIASGSAQMLHNAIASANLSQRPGGAEKVDVAAKPDADGAQKLLNPLDYAKKMKSLAAKQAEDAAAALAPARKLIEARAKDVRDANVAVRKAEIALSNAKDRLESAERQLAKTADGSEEMKAASGVKAEAAAKVTEAEAALADAARAKAEKEQGAAMAQQAYRDADAQRKAALGAIKTWTRRLAPVSIFVSRKTQRLYIRQGHIRVFDVPVTIREPEKPLGTHLYMAMTPEQGAEGGLAALHWLVLTIPDASTGDDEPRRHRRRHRDEEDDAPRIAVPAASASEALNRIEVPAEVESKISELLWAGGSLIVSDKPMSGETGEYTDFVILTR